jgi:bifunctional non-homologous end joining protein LigD
LDWTHRFGGIAGELAGLNLPPALIDGEIVALDSDGNPDFSLLQQRLDADDRGALDLFAFDLLELDGEDLTDIPNIAQGPACGVVARCHRCRARPCRRSLDRGGATLFGTICNMEQEGISPSAPMRPIRPGGRTTGSR